MVGPGAFGAGHVLALNENAEGVVFRREGSIGFQFLTDGDIQLAAGGIVGRDNQGLCQATRRSFWQWRGCALRVGNLLTRPCCWSDSSAAETLAFGQQFDGGFQRRVFLADDLIELGGTHPGLLQLLEWPARFDALVLARVADQEHAVVGAETRKEIAHLVRAGEARLIDKVELPLVRSGSDWAERARNPCKVPDSTPASLSWRAAREVGAKPSTS